MKNLIITLTLLLGVMSYGQTVRAVTTEYTNSAGEMIFVHKNGAFTPPGRCQYGDLPRFALTGQYSAILLPDNRIGIDPDVRNGNTPDGVTYNIVSNADREAFRNDILEDRQSPATAPNIYRTRNGGLSFDTPCGNSGISRGDYLESQPNWSSTGGSSYYFEGIQDTYITLQPNGAMVEIAFGDNIHFESFTDVEDAYNRLQEIFALDPLERELIARDFVDSSDSQYDWENPCILTTIRIDVLGNGRYNVQTFGIQNPNQSIEEARQLVERACTFPDYFAEIHARYPGTISRTNSFHLDVGNGITVVARSSNGPYSIARGNHVVQNDLTNQAAVIAWLDANY